MTSSRPRDLELEVVRVDPRQLGGDDGAWGVGRVGDVDARGEAGAAGAAERPLEDVAEQLVHLAAHALEVGEEVSLEASETSYTAPS